MGASLNRLKRSGKIVLVFVLVGPPAGAFAWAGINMLNGLYHCFPAHCFAIPSGRDGVPLPLAAYVISLPLGAALSLLFLTAFSYVFGGLQALATGIASALYWNITGRLSRIASMVTALAIFVFAAPLISVPATWVSEPFGLKPRALALSMQALLDDPIKLAVWGAVYLVAALAGVMACRYVLDDDLLD